MQVTYRTVSTAEGLKVVLNLPFALEVQKAKARAANKIDEVAEIDRLIAKHNGLTESLERKYRDQIESRPFTLRVYSMGEKLEIKANSTSAEGTVDYAQYQIQQVSKACSLPIADVLELDPTIFSDLAFRADFINSVSTDRLDFLLCAHLN